MGSPHAFGQEAQRVAAELRRCAARVAATGVSLEQRATTVVWHAQAAEAFRGQVRARSADAGRVASDLETAARLMLEHAAAVRERVAAITAAGSGVRDRVEDLAGAARRLPHRWDLP